MFYKIKEELTEKVQACLAATFGVTPEQYRVVIQYPTRTEFGDFSLTFPFELARILRQAPAKTAATFIEAFRPPDEVARVDVAGGGYVNVHLDRRRILLRLLDCLVAGRLWLPFHAEPEKVIVEHTNINPNKAAHIGHLRNAVLGDSLVRLMRFTGRTVEVQNYIDNTGVQVADVVVGFRYLEKLSLEKIRRIPDRFDYYCWDLYARVAKFYEESAENLRLRQQTLQEIEAGDGETAAIAHEVSTRMVHCHLDTMARLGVTYDVLPRESDILDLKFWEAAFARLRQTRAIVFEEEGPNAGCWVMKYERDGQADVKIIVRSNGTVTYTGKDIAYQLWKLGLLDRDFHYEPFRRLDDGHVVWITSATPTDRGGADVPPFGGGDTVYNVIDVRQSYTQNVVYEGVRRLGYEAAAERSIHFAYEMVALSPRCAVELGFELSEEERERSHVEVSGRRGLGVKADDLLDLLEEKALDEVRSRNADMAAEQQQVIAHQIAVGALRYFMVKFTRNSLIVFDFEDALSFEGETGPYLQYSAVRAGNILRKYLDRYAMTREELDAAWRSYTPDHVPELPEDVWELLGTLLKFRDLAQAALTGQEIATFARNLYALSQKFSNFYNRHQIIGEENSDWRNLLLAIVVIYYEKMKRGLEILGIPVPERM
ncbi:MAG: arginine--tRNA ligase [Acidobacteria bacterium]|nr:arginine--tRNA ligase [Acidobacteriota bacterium]